MINKINPRWLIFISFALISMIFISIIVNLVLIGKPNKFGTIDLPKIITFEAQKLASIYPKGEVPSEKLRGLIDSIQGNIQRIALDKKIILLVKSAVLSGNVPDYTDSFIKELEDESSEQN